MQIVYNLSHKAVPAFFHTPALAKNGEAWYYIRYISWNPTGISGLFPLSRGHWNL